jgi:hypothetical protein
MSGAASAHSFTIEISWCERHRVLKWVEQSKYGTKDGPPFSVVYASTFQRSSMKFSVRNSALVTSMVALSSSWVVGAATELPGPEGVLIDISVVDPRYDGTDGKDNTNAVFAPSLDAVKPGTIQTASGAPVTAGQQPIKIDLPEPPKPAPAAASDASAMQKKATPQPTVAEKPMLKTPASELDKEVAMKPEALNKEAVEVSASTEAKETAGRVLTAIVDAMRPEDQIPPLTNDRFSLYLSEKVAFAQYERSAEKFDIDRARTHVAFLYSEERDSIFQGGLALDTSFTSSLRLSFGTRAYVALLNQENTDTFAASFGAETAYRLPFKAVPLEFGASLYYAPDILTFGVGDRVIDAQLDLTLPVRSQLSVFGGIRFLQVDTRPDDREVDNRVHLGVRWDFL